MSTTQIPTRVRFFNGQFLQAADLVDEQAYHVQMRWRHNLALHSWGIVAGLEPSVDGADTKQAGLVVNRTWMFAAADFSSNPVLHTDQMTYP